MDFKPKDPRANPSQKGVFDVKQVTDTKVLQHAMGLKQSTPLITSGNWALEEDCLRRIPTWGLK